MRAAVVQIDSRLADSEHNLGLIEDGVTRAAESGADLAVFPECAVSGYVYASLDEALSVAEPIPGPSSERIAALAADHGLYLVAGMLEREGERCFNTAVLAGPNGIVSTYRKTHVLCLGVDRFTTAGEGPYQVIDLPFGRVGMLICYDLRFPEPARALALQGVQVILLPTNWPQSSFVQADVFTRARAAENRIFVLAADRVGIERGACFLGRSQVIAPDGSVLAEGSRTDPDVLIVDLDLRLADEKHVVLHAGEHEMDCMADRRPELYGALARTLEPTTVP